MKKISEAAFQKSIIELAELHGWLVQHHAHSKGNLRAHTSPGWPDLFLVHPDYDAAAIAAEVKVGRNTTTDAQRRWLYALAGAGCHAVVWRPDPAPAAEEWLFRETAEPGDGHDFGTIGRRLRDGVNR